MEQFTGGRAEQKERHAGGSKWIGMAAVRLGHGGYHPEGIRVGGESAGNRTAVKVWEEAASSGNPTTRSSSAPRNIKGAH